MARRGDFLRAIIEEPDEDTHRLVFADWLDDNGEPERAELIRVQTELATCPEGPRRDALTQRQEKLIAENTESWLGLLREKEYISPLFTRGMLIYSVRSGAFASKTFQEIGREWFPQACVTSLNLFHESKRWDKVFASPLLGQVHSLCLHDAFLKKDGMQQILACRYIGQVRTLKLDNVRVGDTELCALARSSALPRLESLDLHWNVTTLKGFRALIDSPNLSRLSSLRLAGCLVSYRTDLLSEIASLPTCARLRKLDLATSNLNASAVRALFSGPHWSGLQELDLTNNPLGDEGCLALAEAPALAGLRRLTLARSIGRRGPVPANCITDTGIDALLASPYLQKLERLDLLGNPINEADRRALWERFGPRVVLPE